MMISTRAPCLLNNQAKRTRAVGIKGGFNRFLHRHGLHMPGKHFSPGKDLHHIPHHPLAANPGDNERSCGNGFSHSNPEASPSTQLVHPKQNLI